MPAGRISGLTISPTRSTNCSTRPLTPARMTVLSRSTWACASAASALAFSAGSSVEIRSSMPCFAAVAAAIAPSWPCRTDLQPLDLAERNVARIAPVQLLLGLQFVHGLLVRALGLLELAFGLRDIRPRNVICASTSAILRRAVSTAASCFELSSLKIGAPLAIGPLIPTIDLRDPPVCFRKNRDGSEEQRDVGCGRVVVENHA